MNNFFNDFGNFVQKYGYIFLIIGIAIFSSMLIFTVTKLIMGHVNYNKKIKHIINGMSLEDKVNDTKNNQKKKKRYKKPFFLVTLYKEYLFFDGSKYKLIVVSTLGYIVSFVTFWLLSTSVTLGLIFALAWFDLVFIYLDGKNAKKRKKYIKNFSIALRTITASVEAGNTFEEAISNIIKRETIDARIKKEFAFLSNNLKSSKTLEEALDEFWKRNNMFPEFSMFVITMQFFSKKGGEGLAGILVKLSTTLENKVESYQEIDAEMGLNKMLMNLLIIAYFVALLFVKLFMPAFYTNIIDDSLGTLKAFGSVVCLFVGTLFYKSMIRSVAEG